MRIGIGFEQNSDISVFSHQINSITYILYTSHLIIDSFIWCTVYRLQAMPVNRKNTKSLN